MKEWGFGAKSSVTTSFSNCSRERARKEINADPTLGFMEVREFGCKASLF